VLKFLVTLLFHYSSIYSPEDCVLKLRCGMIYHILSVFTSLKIGSMPISSQHLPYITVLKVILWLYYTYGFVI